VAAENQKVEIPGLFKKIERKNKKDEIKIITLLS
jgi:hypothetical protein